MECRPNEVGRAEAEVGAATDGGAGPSELTAKAGVPYDETFEYIGFRDWATEPIMPKAVGETDEVGDEAPDEVGETMTDGSGDEDDEDEPDEQLCCDCEPVWRRIRLMDEIDGIAGPVELP